MGQVNKTPIKKRYRVFFLKTLFESLKEKYRSTYF
ncbi:MAG: hypothetical protein US45_C0041G0002 [Candidatus Nomurabacteria bacterium GW2011_GWA1_37_20]|uniref:Uncharacterized protein n=2 Tax=Parcubacteria group TaxID=1794811 RepID=A0A0G0I714_9BACT|nr:MAG: hypothetical protein US33_C0035G0002 [Parcubacteria group bacterium GW2011_GWC1_36_9]KKQ31618.1 MAG: hypothetical protein US45_C0041G0002 [Candidatus Nomurabacteria bacterium GW2011_GWA1_37_20]KKQ46765.1 MAG: hypothetical protein US65_C0027G0014 [Candidatus Yanofskybacteria bacterium GW2011_GWC2_37_9]